MPTDYLLSAKVFLPKALIVRNWVIRNLRRIQFAMQEEQLYRKILKYGQETSSGLSSLKQPRKLEVQDLYGKK